MFATIKQIFNRKNNNGNNEINEEIHHISDIEFQSKDNIALLRRKTGKIEELNLNYYMLCVVASEMPFKFEYEALKSQVVVARTYLFNKILSNYRLFTSFCSFTAS